MLHLLFVVQRLHLADPNNQFPTPKADMNKVTILIVIVIRDHQLYSNCISDHHRIPCVKAGLRIKRKEHSAFVEVGKVKRQAVKEANVTDSGQGQATIQVCAGN